MKTDVKTAIGMKQVPALLGDSATAWIRRVDVQHLSDEALRKKLRTEPEPLVGLDALPATEAAQRLEAALKAVHVPTTEGLKVMRRFLETAADYARRSYSSESIFTQRLFGAEFEYDRDPTTTMVTSEAGLGKSELCKSLGRLLGPAPLIEVKAPVTGETVVGPLPLQGWIHVCLDSDTRSVNVMNLIGAAADPEAPLLMSSRSNSMSALRRLLYSRGVSLIVIDELQFLFQSAGASTQIVKTLGMVRQLGIPLFYIGNYSLAHKLKARPQQDRHRYLMDPIVMLPPMPDSEDEEMLMDAYYRVTGGVIDLRDLPARELVHWNTAGNLRSRLLLLKLAYKEMRARTQKDGLSGAGRVVTLEDIRAAYACAGYSDFRETAVATRKQLETSRRDRRHSDLWCPFELSAEQKQQQADLGRKLKAAHVAREKVTASMTATEKEAVKNVAKVLKAQPVSVAPKPLQPKGAAPLKLSVQESQQRTNELLEKFRKGERL